MELTARLWSIAMYRLLQVHSLAFQCDGSLVATGDTGGVGRLWDTRSGKCLMTLKVRGHVLAHAHACD